MKQLEGITMESTVITERMFRVIKKMSEQGKLDIREFPLLKHLGEVICDGKPADIDWESFLDTNI